MTYPVVAILDVIIIYLIAPELLSETIKLAYTSGFFAFIKE